MKGNQLAIAMAVIGGLWLLLRSRAQAASLYDERFDVDLNGIINGTDRDVIVQRLTQYMGHEVEPNDVVGVALDLNRDRRITILDFGLFANYYARNIGATR